MPGAADSAPTPGFWNPLSGSGVSDGHLRGRQPALEALRSNQGTENSLLKLILLPRICFHVFRRHRLMMTYLPASLMPADASRFRFQIQEKLLDPFVTNAIPLRRNAFMGNASFNPHELLLLHSGVD